MLVGGGTYGLCHWQASAGVDAVLEQIRPAVSISYESIQVDPLRGELFLKKLRISPANLNDQISVAQVRISDLPLSQWLLGGDGSLPSFRIQATSVEIPRSGALFGMLDARFPGDICSRHGSWLRSSAGQPESWVSNVEVVLSETDFYGKYGLQIDVQANEISRLHGNFDLTFENEEIDRLATSDWPSIDAGAMSYSVDTLNHQLWLSQCASEAGLSTPEFISAMIGRQNYGWMVGNLQVKPAQSSIFRHWMKKPTPLLMQFERVSGEFWPAMVGVGEPEAPFTAREFSLRVDEMPIELAELTVFTPAQALAAKRQLVNQAHVLEQSPRVADTAAEVAASQVQRTREVYRRLPASQASSYAGSSARVFVRGRRDPREGVLKRADRSSIELVQHFARGDFSMRIPRHEISRLEVLVTEEYLLN